MMHGPINIRFTSDMIAYITKRGGGGSLHFCDWSTLSLIFLHIIYSFTLPSFEFLTNSESDQLHFHTEIILFPSFPYLLIFSSASPHPAYSIPISVFYWNPTARGKLELNFGFLHTVPLIAHISGTIYSSVFHRLSFILKKDILYTLCQINTKWS